MFRAQRPRLVEAPGSLPVSLDEAKAHLRVEHSEDDLLIAAQLAAATAYLDGWSGILGRCLVAQSWARAFSAFPACDEIHLPFPDATSVAVTYRPPGASVDTTLSSALYEVVRTARGDVIRLVSGATWPATEDLAAAVTITATYGYGTAADVPASIRAALLLMIGDLYRYRETVAVGVTSAEIRTSLTVDRLLAPYRFTPVIA
jgi:uncharacterized phiE125 gp8 family phage protein